MQRCKETLCRQTPYRFQMYRLYDEIHEYRNVYLALLRDHEYK